MTKTKNTLFIVSLVVVLTGCFHTPSKKPSTGSPVIKRDITVDSKFYALTGNALDKSIGGPPNAFTHSPTNHPLKEITKTDKGIVTTSYKPVPKAQFGKNYSEAQVKFEWREKDISPQARAYLKINCKDVKSNTDDAAGTILPMVTEAEAWDRGEIVFIVPVSGTWKVTLDGKYKLHPGVQNGGLANCSWIAELIETVQRTVKAKWDGSDSLQSPQPPGKWIDLKDSKSVDLVQGLRYTLKCETSTFSRSTWQGNPVLTPNSKADIDLTITFSK